jgi:hypothetical protein
MLWLCPGIEAAFDTMKLSFVSRLLPGMITGYTMMIWDDTCLNDNLGVGTSQTIRDVYAPEKYLNFTITASDGTSFEHSVYKRCLANQAIWCHYQHNNMFPPSVWTLGDFSSVDELVHKNLVKNEYCGQMSLQRVIELEIEEEGN